MTKFKDLGLKDEFAEALEKVGYTDPTPIQEQAIPELLKGSDVIGQAQTGTGKTAAFGLPMLQSIIPDRREVQALVLTPTRELCIQVAQSLRAYGAIAGVDVLATFGGAPIRQQMDRLKNGPQVVVGTVGRVLDLHSRHSLMFHDARFVVLDEADEMLDLGFLEDVETILNKCPRGRQTALFSATMPPAIAKLAAEQLHDPVTIRVKAPTLTIDTVQHFQFPTSRNSKADDIIKILEAERPTQAIIFARTKIGVDRLARDLDRRKPNLRVRALHGDMSQGSRDGVMIAFKDNRVPVLVATDIAARGLDVQNVTHVINYDLPNSAEIYTHRIGRTGRAGRGGRAITMVEARDKDDFRAIEKHINVDVPEWTPEIAKTKAPAPAKAGGDGEKADAAEGGERTPRQRRPRSRDGEKTESVTEEVAVVEEAEAQTTEEVVTEDAVTDAPVSEEAPAQEDPVAESPAAEQPAEQESTGFTWGAAPAAAAGEPAEDLPDPPAPPTGDELEAASAEESEPEPSAGVIPDRSSTEEASKAEFSWGPPPGKTQEALLAEDADEPVADATPEVAAEPESEPEPEPTADAEPGELRRPRHTKPEQTELDEGFSLVIVNGGTSAGVEPADVIELVTAKSDLTGNDIRRVRVLSRYTLMQVPSDKAASVAGAIEGAELRGRSVSADAVVAEAS
ncbi:MAG: DEAD/DEAH box helicase [Solirubrobacterales bacterium]